MSILEIFKTNWLTTSFSGVLFLAVTYLLYWNESQAIMTSKALHEAKKTVITIDAYNNNYKQQYEGKLIHAVGQIDIMEPLTEPDYNIQVMSVKLKKRVQMYQWIEEAREPDGFGDTLDSNTDISTYSYHKDWRDFLVDSNLFYISPGHHNPKDMPISAQTFTADSVKIGWITLGSEIKRKFNDYYDITSDERPDRRDIKLHSGAYYHGADPLVHEVGDLRVLFSYAGRQDDEYSILGSLQHGVVHSYTTSPSQEPLVLLRKGRYTAEEMLHWEHRDLGSLVWRYRAVGWFQMFAAGMSLPPAWSTYILSCRWLSWRVRHSSLSKCRTNFIVSLSLTLAIISCAWCMYYPALAFGLFLIAVSPLVYYSKLSYWFGVHDCQQ